GPPRCDATPTPGTGADEGRLDGRRAPHAGPDEGEGAPSATEPGCSAAEVRAHGEAVQEEPTGQEGVQAPVSVEREKVCRQLEGRSASRRASPCSRSSASASLES